MSHKYQQAYQGQHLTKTLRDSSNRNRVTASTILNQNGFAPGIIEHQLAHCGQNKIRATTYNHAQLLPERREMMDWWGDWVEKGEEL
jgi:hypothetical protein